MIKEYFNIINSNKLGGKIQNLLNINKFFNIPKGFIITEEEDLKIFDINAIYKEYLNTDFYICRSSMNNEDSKNISYAGLFESIEGNIDNGWLLEDILEVFNSLNNDFLDEYEKRTIGKKLEKRKMNVLIQEFIVGEVSGIYFSNYKGNRLIEYIKGCNQFLVDGIVKSNKIILDKYFNILKYSKNKQYKYIGKKLDVFIYDKINDSLSEENLNKLLSEFKKLENYFNFDIDVEWTIKKGKIYILQVRPITIK